MIKPYVPSTAVAKLATIDPHTLAEVDESMLRLGEVRGRRASSRALVSSIHQRMTQVWRTAAQQCSPINTEDVVKEEDASDDLGTAAHKSATSATSATLDCRGRWEASGQPETASCSTLAWSAMRGRRHDHDTAGRQRSERPPDRGLDQRRKPRLRPHCSDAGSWLWLSDDPADRVEGARLCQGCPVFDPCDEVWQHQRFGVWAGHDRTRAPGKAA